MSIREILSIYLTNVRFSSYSNLHWPDDNSGGGSFVNASLHEHVSCSCTCLANAPSKGPSKSLMKRNCLTSTFSLTKRSTSRLLDRQRHFRGARNRSRPFAFCYPYGKRLELQSDVWMNCEFGLSDGQIGITDIRSDVFMDNANREISMKLLVSSIESNILRKVAHEIKISASRQSTEKQFIFITPQSMGSVDREQDVNIIKYAAFQKMSCFVC